MDEILLSGLFFIGGIVATLIGTVVADKLNYRRKLDYAEKEHKYKIRYLKEEIFFRKKLEALTELTKEIENEESTILFITELLDVENGEKLPPFKEISSLLDKISYRDSDLNNPFFLGYSPFIDNALFLEIRDARLEISNEFMKHCEDIYVGNKETKKKALNRTSKLWSKANYKFREIRRKIQKEIRKSEEINIKKINTLS